MATVPSWQAQPEAWDKLRLGNDWLPGPVKVTLAQDISSGLDVRKAPKTNRAALVDQGYNPVKAVIEFSIGFEPIDPGWPSAADQFKLWQGIFERIRPKRAQKRVALTISHPMFVMCGVNSVYVESVSLPIGEGPGLRTLRITVIEVGPIVSAASVGATGTVAVAKPKGSTALSSLNRAPNPAVSSTGPG
jgi:hypothetical protein